MPISQQRIVSVNFTKLKNLQNLYIDFSEGPLIAIMGVNGAGKSTILHALACCYKPDSHSRKDYKFSDFFLPNTFALWNDSDFTIKYSYRDGAREYNNIERQYQKKERWTPRYSNRPERYLKDYVCTRYLVQTPEVTLCQTAISTDSILQLTGDHQRPIHIYVEDKLSQSIITRICTELNCKRYVRVFLFGPAVNSFTIISGKVLNGEDTSKTIAVLDGDRHTPVGGWH